MKNLTGLRAELLVELFEVGVRDFVRIVLERHIADLLKQRFLFDHQRAARIRGELRAGAAQDFVGKRQAQAEP